MPKMPQHYRAMYDADYWGAWDLESGDKTVTITKVIGGELTGPGGKKSKKPVLYVQGSEKGIPLNKTNGKTIANLYGNYVTEWIGKPITLYKSSTRNPQDGGEIDCIRIRATATAPVEKRPPTPQERTAAIVARFQPLGVTQEQLATHLGKDIASATKADLEAAWAHFEAKPEVDPFVADMEQTERTGL